MASPGDVPLGTGARLEIVLPLPDAPQTGDDLAVVGDKAPCANDFLGLRHQAINVHRLWGDPAARRPEPDDLDELPVQVRLDRRTGLEETAALRHVDAIDLRRTPFRGVAGHEFSIVPSKPSGLPVSARQATGSEQRHYKRAASASSDLPRPSPRRTGWALRRNSGIPLNGGPVHQPVRAAQGLNFVVVLDAVTVYISRDGRG